MSDSRLLIPDGVKPEFVLDNTEKRSCTIFPEESGCHRYQIFRSEDLPEKILFQYIGMVRNPDETASPKYKAQAVTSKELRLFGKRGLENGFSIMDKICKTLLEGQKDITIARSIKRSDLQEGKGENFTYWLASGTQNELLGVQSIDPDIIICGSVPGSNNSMIFSYDLSEIVSLPVRPTVVLKKKIRFSQNETSKVTWVDL